LQIKLDLVKGINHRDLQNIAVVPGEGIVALDRKGIFLSMNVEAEALLGWGPADLLGSDFFNRIGFSLHNVANLGASPCPAVNTVTCPHLHTDARLTRKDGTPLSVTFMLHSLFDEGRVSGKVFVFRAQSNAALEQQLSRDVVEHAASIIVKLDADGRVTFANRHGQWLFGAVSVEDLIPEAVVTLLRDSPHQLDQQTLLDRRRLEGQEREVCIAWSVAVLRDEWEQVCGAVCIGNDFTDHHHTLKGRLQDGLMAQKVFEHIRDGVVCVDRGGRVEYINPTAERLTGWSRDEAIGQLFKDVYHVVDEYTQEVKEDVVSRCLRKRSCNEPQSNGMLLGRSGLEIFIQEAATPVHDQDGNMAGAVVVFSDVSELRGMERWLEYEVSHDALTGLLNRRQFEAQLKLALESVRNEGRHHAFLYLDLDQFKLVNDCCGHAAGDTLLKQISSLLKDHLAEGDSVARLGGDEFGIILEDHPLQKAQRLAKNLCKAVRDFRFVWDERPFEIGVSIGLVPISAHWRELAEILRVADSACYVAKELGRNRVHVYQEDDLALRRREDEMQWIQRVRHALEEGRFRLYCQNIVPLAKGGGGGAHYEILLRMVDDEGNVMRPGAFIAAAERYHLMPAVDRWVVENAFSLLGARRGGGSEVFSINLSGQSLDDDEFLGFVIDQLERHDVSPETVCFEITESVAALNLMVARRFMSILRGMGCRFALDDFGKGMASFAYLKNLEVDYIKIDGMFVKDLADDEVGYAMVESINKIGHIMGVQTIAEFVESQAVLEQLITLGVDHVQGYQLGRPRPLQPLFRAPTLVQ
jgi:diguanylate cyclase (GGDEF)-like protein/PAS domain S-box-containing protein